MRRRAPSLRWLALVPLCASACQVTYRPRHAPSGDPAVPAAHLERVTLHEANLAPGTITFSHHHHTEWWRPIVTRDGLEKGPSNLDFEHTTLWELRLDAGARTDLLDMTWNSASAPGCEPDHPALDLLVDDAEPFHGVWFANQLVEAPERQLHWERPIVLHGEHAITGRFEADGPLLDMRSVLDVRLVQYDAAGPRPVCLRVPVTGPDVTFRADDEWSFGGRLSWRRSLAFSKSSTLELGLSLERWLGPVRVGVAGTIGGTDSTTDGPRGTGACFIDPGPDCDNINLGTLALETGGLAWRWRRWAVGWSLSYETLFASVRPSSTTAQPARLTHAISGGPRLGLQLLRAREEIPRAERIGPTSAWGLELFAAAAQEWRGAARGSPLTLGASLLWF